MPAWKKENQPHTPYRFAHFWWHLQGLGLCMLSRIAKPARNQRETSENAEKIEKLYDQSPESEMTHLPTNLQWSSTIKPGGNPWVIGVYLDTFSRFFHHFLLESSGGTAGPGKVQLGELHHSSASLCQGGAWPWSRPYARLGAVNVEDLRPKMVPFISTSKQSRGG